MQGENLELRVRTVHSTKVQNL